MEFLEHYHAERTHQGLKDALIERRVETSNKKRKGSHMTFATGTELYDAVERYTDDFYNPTRRHSLLRYVSSSLYERRESHIAD